MRDESSKPSWLCGVLRLRQDELLIHGLIVRHTLTGRRRRSRTTVAKIMAAIAKHTEAQASPTEPMDRVPTNMSDCLSRAVRPRRRGSA